MVDLPATPAYTLEPTHPVVGRAILLRHPIGDNDSGLVQEC
jgi:hypothetical protein